MARIAVKEKSVPLPVAVRDVKSKINAIADEYASRLNELGDTISCVVKLKTEKPSGDFVMLDIVEKKQSISFQYDNMAYGYKTISHVLSAEGHSYGLACMQNGDIELYEISDDSKSDSFFAGSIELADVISDPMFAFESKRCVYVVMNVPSLAALNSGQRARKPVMTEDGLVIAKGSPSIVKFNAITGEAEVVSPIVTSIQKYAAALVDDPESSLPMLMVANVLAGVEPEEEEPSPTFGALFAKLLIPEEILMPDAHTLPLGVSVTRVGNDGEYEQIPMGGNDGIGIVSVEIDEGKEDEESTVRIAVSDEEEPETVPTVEMKPEEELAPPPAEVDFSSQETQVMCPV